MAAHQRAADSALDCTEQDQHDDGAHVVRVIIEVDRLLFWRTSNELER